MKRAERKPLYRQATHFLFSQGLPFVPEGSRLLFFISSLSKTRNFHSHIRDQILTIYKNFNTKIINGIFTPKGWLLFFQNFELTPKLSLEKIFGGKFMMLMSVYVKKKKQILNLKTQNQYRESEA